MKKDVTKKDYDNYMKKVDDYIKKAETLINDLAILKQVKQLSYEDWVKFQNGDVINL